MDLIPSQASDVRHDDAGPRDRRLRPFLVLSGVLALLGAVLVVYSQTMAFTWDEGFHLLAAQLINAGKRPYLDFCFPQTPLNAWWNAAWMRIFGETWRTAHALAALLTAGAVVLIADFLWRRSPAPSWRLAGALTAAVMVGVNIKVIAYGTLGQPYGMCLFLTVVSFRLAILAVDRRGPFLTVATGFFAGASAAASLLTATVAPVLLCWMLLYNRVGTRWRKFAAFVTGAAVPFLPVLWLFVKAPRVVWFNLAQYHIHYRSVYWPGSTSHDLEVLTSWLDDSQALLLGLLAVAGLLYIAKRSGWDRPRRAEFYLCGWLAVGIGAELSFAHPTFQRYFVTVVPFVAVLALVGLYAIGSRVLTPDRPLWPVLIVTVLAASALVRALYQRSNDVDTWAQYELIARKVEQVTPPHGSLFAEAPLYFLTRRRPPSGMEFDYSHKLKLTANQAAALHILSETELKRRLAAGMFSTAVSCDEDEADDLKLPKLYSHKAEVQECVVFWGPTSKPDTPAAAAPK